MLLFIYIRACVLVIIIHNVRVVSSGANFGRGVEQSTRIYTAPRWSNRVLTTASVTCSTWDKRKAYYIIHQRFSMAFVWMLDLLKCSTNFAYDYFFLLNTKRQNWENLKFRFILIYKNIPVCVIIRLSIQIYCIVLN